MIEKERIKFLNEEKTKNREYVVYWMQNAQRVDFNHALNYAIERANDLEKKLVVFFGITDSYPEANIRHYEFMVEGLKEVKKNLEKIGIKFLVKHTSPEKGIIELSKKASLVVVDKGYLKIERKWREIVSQNIDIPLIEIETNLTVPIEITSLKEEYGAYTIRNKIWKNLLIKDAKSNIFINLESSSDKFKNEFDLERDFSKLSLDKSVEKTKYFIGGVSEARKKLDKFLNIKLEKYEEFRNSPEMDFQSDLSPYLHFGQISPIEIYLKVKDFDNSKTFLEELIVRRELSYNFVYYNDDYDNFKSLPKWATETLEKHSGDKREYNYSRSELEKGRTHDKYWNAAQIEMKITGKMHGYMRMYWGKKVIEWTEDPKEAYEILIYLNNKYSLDGRDPNSYAGIAWCFGKHDRPWKEREIFGKIRYMNDKGLIRKFKIDDYVKKINELSEIYEQKRIYKE